MSLGLGSAFLASCDDDAATIEPLAEPTAGLQVFVVQDAASVSEDEQQELEQPVMLMSSSGAKVAVATATPRVVPILWGETTADPTTDYLQVAVDVEDAFSDVIDQIELKIDVHSDGTIDWCRPMNQAETGFFVINLQPGCDERDPLTDDCVVSTEERCSLNIDGCREDLLTFTMWDDISSDCHDWPENE